MYKFSSCNTSRLKGCGGYNIAILEQLKEWGSSCHYVDENIDTGSIIDVDLFSIDPLIETAKSLESKTLKVMESQFIRIIQNIGKIDGKLKSFPNIGGKYISREEMELMKEITDADDPEIKSRAFFFPPYLGAYVKINEKKMTVISQTILKELAKNDQSSLFTSNSSKMKNNLSPNRRDKRKK